ncbi:MAG: efflux RND transporter periplasmic adaptor subunit [Candidatus Staskawiczbacteria bacterium]|jgi:HlyD family secretion protein
MKIPKFFRKKRNIWIIAILVVIIIIIGYILFFRNNSSGNIQTGFATKQNLQETVLSTGQVVSGTDLDLSFQGSGVARKILVQEGVKVYQGQLLASLDQSGALATLTSAQGALAQAQANYEKLLAGATQQTINTSQDSVSSAKQDLADAYNGATNTLNNAYSTIYNSYNVAVSMQNNYFSSQDPQGIQVQNSKSDINSNMQNAQNYLNISEKSMAPSDIDATVSQMILALNNVYSDVNIIRTQCDQGIYYFKVSTTDKASLDAQKTSVNTTLTSVTALQQNISSLKLALQKAEDQLSVTTSPPTQADIDSAKAQILSAQGQVDSAQAVLNNSVITAPVSGTITQVDIKVGEQAVASKEVLVLQDVGDLHAEADVSEANIATLQVGQPIDYTFDALGPDQHFTGKVLTINPASTVISGVVDYLVKGSLDNIPNIKPGMTANMTILVAKKDNALAVPSTAVINKNNNQYVRVIDNAKTKTYHQVQVQTGLQADGGLVEITSGLSDGQEIVTYVKP